MSTSSLPQPSFFPLRIDQYRPWSREGPDIIPTLPQKHLDYQCRHTLQLLQELYRYGRPLSLDRITTQRCNHVLQSLYLDHDNKDTHVPLDESTAIMADMILSFMEAFDMDFVSNTAFTDNNNNNNKNKSTDNINNDINLQHQETLFEYNHHMELPRPDKHTYNHVLRICSRTIPKDDHIPNRTRGILQRMRYRYQHVAGALDCQPHAFHYNCVLLAWMEYRHDWQRAAHACQFLLQHRQDIGEVDTACYITLLRICAHKLQNEKERELGAKIAVRIWQDPQGPKNPPSHYYSHMLQAMRHLPRSRVEMFRDVFQSACRHGKVNEAILREFVVHAKSQGLLAECLPISQARDMSVDESVQVLLAALPREHKAHAD